MIKYLLLATIFFTCLSAFSQDNEVCHSKNSSGIIQIFDKGIVLNEKFKKSVEGNDKDEYQRLRKKIEQYDEGVVMPCVGRASQLMSSRSNSALMHKLMELVISYENSADETISYEMGRLFAVNSKAVEHTIKEFPPSGKKIILKSIQTGWINVKPELSPSVGKSGDERLKKLLLSEKR